MSDDQLRHQHFRHFMELYRGGHKRSVRIGDRDVILPPDRDLVAATYYCHVEGLEWRRVSARA